MFPHGISPYSNLDMKFSATTISLTSIKLEAFEYFEGQLMSFTIITTLSSCVECKFQ
jgi:hypothetical protein